MSNTKHILPEGDYVLSDEGAWFTLRNLSIKIRAQNFGAKVSIFPLDKEDESELASAYASFDEKFIATRQDARGEVDHDIILAIQEKLDGTVWEMSMLSQIADLLTDHGYEVADRK